MAKRSKQTFRKRQRELAKKRKKEAKAERLAARRADKTSEDNDKEDPAEGEEEPDFRESGGKKILRVRLTGSKSDE